MAESHENIETQEKEDISPAENENFQQEENIISQLDSEVQSESKSAPVTNDNILETEDVSESIKTDIDGKAAKVDIQEKESAADIEPKIKRIIIVEDDCAADVEKTVTNDQEKENSKMEEAESHPDQEIPSTSDKKRKLSDTPEDIINLLKTLSPEKLLEIKSKVLEITDKKESNTKKIKTDDTVSESEERIDTQSENTQESSSNDVICLDSDDDEGSKPAEKPTDSNAEPENKIDEEQNEQKEPEAATAVVEMEDIAEQSVEGNHSHSNGDSNQKKLKECVNPKCPRNKNDQYLECPGFVLSMYYIDRKPNKVQWVCSTCYNESIEMYEKLCSKLLSNESWTEVQIPKKQDLVEIIDLDEEDEFDKSQEKKESSMVIFNAEVEKEVEKILTGLISKIDFGMQIQEEYKKIELKTSKNKQLLDDITKEVTQLERKSYSMSEELNSFNRPKIQRRPSLSLNVELPPEPSARIALEKSHPEVSITPIVRPSPSALIQKSLVVTTQEQDKVCYAVRQRSAQMLHWMPCRIIEEIPNQDEKKYKVQFCDNLPNSVAIVSGKELSVSQYSEKLEIGARVIALFPRSVVRNKQHSPIQKRFLPGVIGEKLTQYNKRRYLVFCDYGQVRYCTANEVRAIQESSENVWDDVHPNLRQFIREYLEIKTNRSRTLLNVRVNTQILTERGGNWRKTIVQEVDCSLVKVLFTAEHVSEWLYRGSKRLFTMYQQTQRVANNTFQRRTDPGAFSYITIDDDDAEESASGETKRNTAKKSTAKPQQQQVQTQQPGLPAAKQPIILNDSFIYMDDPAIVAKVRYFTPKAGICAKKYVKHDCSPSCSPRSENDLSSFIPLSKPLLSCWERQIVRQKKNRFVVYKAPCGRRLRSMNEVFIYLGITKCKLNVDNFDFHPATQVLASYYVEKNLCPLYIDDITQGKEGMKVSCINAFDNQRPPPLEYSAHRIPMNGVNINTDPEFMSCCDCTDECVDKSKCACFQLTIRGAKYKNLMEEDEENISYLWKRLLSVVPTGIYECNSRCKCSSRCLNKVVQEPVRVKMQLYRTKARGWGLQSLHDIPKGTFICIYAGNLYTEKDANALCQGLDHGDEYFAELDLIENAENRKEGYESGVVNPDESEEEKDSDSDYDDKNDSHDYEDGDFVSKSRAIGQREIVTRSSRNSANDSKKTSASSTPQRQNSDTSDDDEMVNMIPNANNNGNLGYPEGMRIPFRKLYGPKEKVYIMDAKRCGNVGRYFNHSCDPNLFVQSVFVDTHDLRFPWIAFFAQRPIKAGEELTWNYNYEVGSVPSKVLYCKCGSKVCRGRIL